MTRLSLSRDIAVALIHNDALLTKLCEQVSGPTAVTIAGWSTALSVALLAQEAKLVAAEKEAA